MFSIILNRLDGRLPSCISSSHSATYKWLHNWGNQNRRTYAGGIQLFINSAGIIAYRRGMCRPVLVIEKYVIHVSWTCESFKKSRTLELLILTPFQWTTENSFMKQWGKGPRGVGWGGWRSYGIQGNYGEISCRHKENWLPISHQGDGES